MRLLKSDLLPAVQSLVHIAAKRISLPIIGSLRLEACGGKLSIRASDLDQDATALVDCKKDFPPFCVNARHFAKLVECANESIDLSPNGKAVELKSDWQSSLPILPAEEFPSALFKDGKAQGLPTGLIADGIEAVRWACSTDPNRYNMSGVHIVTSAAAIVCEATNSHVMGHLKAAGIAAKCELNIPGAFAGKVAEALRQPGATLFVSESAVSVRHAAGEYSAKLVDESARFPSTKAITDGSRSAIGEISIPDLKWHLQTILAISTDDWTKVLLKFSPRGCAVTMATDKPQQYAVTVGGKFPELDFQTDAKALLKSLESLGDCEALNGSITENKLLVFCKDDYSTFIAPLRTK